MTDTLSRPAVPVAVRPIRQLGDITFDAWLEESHEDALTITDHPVEQGASISDHAFLKPRTVSLRYGVSDAASDLASDGARRSIAVYERLLELQGSREPFDLVTGKRLYRNMLIETLSTVTDASSGNALIVTIDCREVIIVNTAVSTLPPRTRHAAPNQTGGTTDTGNKQPQDAARKSALAAAFGSGDRPGGP